MPNFAIIRLESDAFRVFLEVLGTAWYEESDVDKAHANLVLSLIHI